MLRHHRLLERYLADSLGMSLDEVHAEADRLEHVLSEELEARIDEALGYPDASTRTAIRSPTASCGSPRSTSRSLADLVPGDTRRRRAVFPTATRSCSATSRSSPSCRAQTLELTRSAPFGGPLTVRTGSGEHAIARELAASVGIA